MSRFSEVKEYLLETGETEESIINNSCDTFNLALQIMVYAHRGVYRADGNLYISHPINCVKKYENFIKPIYNDSLKANRVLMKSFGIPYDGVKEVCLLHDVIEDSDFTLEEVEEIFSERGHSSFFKEYIKDALDKITHKKEDDYPAYISKCIENPISAIAKLMDLVDNSNPLTLNKLEEKEFNRINNYTKYIKMINDKYHFVENVKTYKFVYEAMNKDSIKN